MTAKVSKKVNAVVVGKDSKAADKSKNKLKKQASKREEQREKEKDDAVVEISMDHVLTLASSIKPSGPKVTATPAADSADDSDDSEIEAQESALDLKGKVNGSGLKAFEQRDLVALAFAGDNVVQVCFELSDVEPFLTFVLHRASRMRNGEKLPQMHQEKLIPPFLVG